MLTILLVCTGNTCRSAMAAALLKDLLVRDRDLSEYRVLSAGLAALEGGAASANAIRVMEEEGIDLSGHTSSALSSKMVAAADLILVMTYGHRGQLLARFPEAAGKTYTLKQYIGFLEKDFDIVDPYGGDLSVYRQSLKDIKNSITKLIIKLKGGDRQ